MAWSSACNWWFHSLCPEPTWCGFFALVLGPIWLAYNRHGSGFGTWMLLGSASSKKALLVNLLCHSCTRGVVFWCFEQLGHVKSIGDEFQQDFRPIGDPSSCDNGCSTPYLLPSRASMRLVTSCSRIWRIGWKHTPSTTQMHFFVCSSWFRLYDGNK
jgi:hypothetical protein